MRRRRTRKTIESEVNPTPMLDGFFLMQGSVVIRADVNSKNGLRVEGMGAARTAGVGNVSLAAEIVK
jgi:biopolymer transport protein ExbD